MGAAVVEGAATGAHRERRRPLVPPQRRGDRHGGRRADSRRRDREHARCEPGCTVTLAGTPAARGLLDSATASPWRRGREQDDALRARAAGDARRGHDQFVSVLSAVPPDAVSVAVRVLPL